MLFLYNLAWILLHPFLYFYLKVRVKKGKEDPVRFNEKLGTYKIKDHKNVLWFHAASLGESKSVLPIITYLIQKGHKILITTGTLTSSEAMQSLLPSGAIHQFVPLDSPILVKKFIKYFKPKALILVESEFWPNLISVSKKSGLKLIFLNAKFSQKSLIKWLKYKNYFTNLLSKFDVIYTSAQKQGSEVFTSLNVNYQMIDSLKYASATAAKPSGRLNIKCEDGYSLASKNSILLISTHGNEESLIFSLLKDLKNKVPNTLFVIAPRHLNRIDEVAANLSKFNLKCKLYSKNEVITHSDDVLILDEMGLIADACIATKISIVCGSFVDGIGGHNILEPASLERPTLTGIYNENFQDIIDAMQLEDAVMALKPEDVIKAVSVLFQNKSRYNEYALNAKRFVDKKSQSYLKTAEEILSLCN
jgi:3-deoxy-D-manno-octulosonic-acid transferase